MPSLLIPQQSNTRDFFHNFIIMQCAKPVWLTPDFIHWTSNSSSRSAFFETSRAYVVRKGPFKEWSSFYIFSRTCKRFFLCFPFDTDILVRLPCLALLIFSLNGVQSCLSLFLLFVAISPPSFLNQASFHLPLVSRIIQRLSLLHWKNHSTPSSVFCIFFFLHKYSLGHQWRSLKLWYCMVSLIGSLPFTFVNIYL